jgi:hypothetical protein
VAKQCEKSPWQSHSRWPGQVIFLSV